MRIGVDVMGGDNAPKAILDGCFAALDALDDADELVLFGDQGLIDTAISAAGLSGSAMSVVGTSQIVDMAESPVEAVRNKPDSSLVVMAKAAGRKAANPLDAIISAGNTGAMVTAGQMFMRRLPNVHRPGIGVLLPTFAGPVVLIDVGANLQPKPHHLAQYGIMGDVWARISLGKESPRVALLNVGGEAEKGTEHMRQARDFLREAEGVNFIGYVEGRGVFDGDADVIITDGVVGNVMIKLAEGLSKGIFKAIGREVFDADPDLARRFEPIVKKIYAKHDYHEYGGAPLLGVNGTCLICHGSSEDRTIVNAIARTKHMVDSGTNDAISRRLGALEEVVG